MRSEQAKIVNKLGIHARSASKFVALAKSFPCQVRIGRDENDLQNGKSIMGVLMIAADRGATVLLQTEGDEEDDAMTALLELIADKFGEQD